MKTWFIILTVIVLLVTPASALAAPQEPGNPSTLQPIVHIIHTQRIYRDNQLFIHTSDSLGTVIGPHLVLTHNHFGATLGTQADETFTFIDSTGRTFQVLVAEVERIVIDRGTQLLRLPETVNLTSLPVAGQVAINRLAAGTWLTVNYWDDAHQQMATKDFQLIKAANGVAQLADPGRVINHGDSGGGVFFAGRLIGNTWSYNSDAAGNSLGSFNVALVPARVAATLQTLN